MKLEPFLKNTNNLLEIQAAAIWTNLGYELDSIFGEYSFWTRDAEPAFMMRYNHKNFALEVKPLRQWSNSRQSVTGTELCEVYEFWCFDELLEEDHFQEIAA